MEDSLILNLTTQNFKPQTPKEQLNSTEKRKRKLSDSTPSETKITSYDHASKKRKFRQSTTTEKHQVNKQGKVSSIFRNNPDIPFTESGETIQVTEKIFTDQSFSTLGIHSFLVSVLENKMGFSQMTSIQRDAIPAIKQGGDVLVKSQTGSGKTLTYALPIVDRLQAIQPAVKRADGPYAIIIVPTRELAIQSMETLQQLVKAFVRIVPGCLMGGENRQKEKSRLRKGVNILVTTPGRLSDHLKNTDCLKLDHLQCIVIDEADRLLELGFEKSVSDILTTIKDRCGNAGRQTILLSATLTDAVERLASVSLTKPTCINPSDMSALANSTRHHTSDDETTAPRESSANVHATPNSLKHYFCVVPSKLRLVTLATFILSKCKKNHKMLVFFATQESVNFHHRLFTTCYYGNHDNVANDNEEHQKIFTVPMYKLHGNMKQQDRTRVFDDFRKGDSGVLLCTDVASRGLDLPSVRWIIQYNVSTSETDYIHRVGRTARVGAEGQALLFLQPSETLYVKELNQANISITEISMDSILEKLSMFCDDLMQQSKYKSRPKTETLAINLQICLEKSVDEGGSDLRSIARKAYQSFIQAYSTFPSHLKYIFRVKNLHLGHVAKSFCLHEAPTQIGSTVAHYGAKRRENQKKNRSKPKKNFQHMSEFDSGVDGKTTARKIKHLKRNATRKKFKNAKK